MIGRQIGRYLLNQELGRGGMGVVYKATQVTLNRTVAIKILSPHLAASHEYLARFRREAETLARLSHENIVHIYDVDEVEGSHFIAMEFVDGASLTSILARRGPLSPACARDVAAAIASALAVAHRQGIVHRDIKPDNILVSQSGQAKLTDFGIAHMRDGRVETLAGVLLGTPYYMSPEQAAGRPISAASDLYSLAVVLYEMVSGRVPFEAADPLALALKHVQEPPPALRRIAPRVPEPLVREVERALRKEPAERHSSAEELQQRLVGLDLGVRPGLALTAELATRSHPSIARCPECATPIEPAFLTCPHCGLSIRYRCATCSTRFDALSPACPVCNAIATPPELRLPVKPAAKAPPPSPPPPPPPSRSEPAVMPAAARVQVAVAHTAEAPIPAAPQVGPAPRPAIAPAARAAAIGAAAEKLLARAWLEIKRGADDLVLLVKQLRDRSAPAPTLRQLMVAGVATTLVVALVLGIWQPWRISLADVPSLPPSGDFGALPQSPDPVSSASESQVTRRVTPPATAPEGSGNDGQGAGEAAPTSPPPPPTSSGRAASGDSVSAAAGGSSAEAARHAIEDIIERQRRATESGNVESLTADLDRTLGGKAADQLRTLHDSVTSVASRITRIRIDLTDNLPGAEVRFHARVTGVRRSTKQALTVFDGEVRWGLRRSGSPPRWVITSSSGT